MGKQATLPKTKVRSGRRARWARRLRAAADFFPLTPLGLVVVAGTWFAWDIYANGQTDHVLRAAVLMGLGLVCAAVLGMGLTTALVVWRLRRGEGRVDRRADVGVPFETALRLPRTRWWPLVSLDVRWDGPPDCTVTLIDHPEGGARERVVARARGRLAHLTRRITVRDIFGLSALSIPLRAEANLRVQPAMAPGEMRLALRHASAEGHAHPDGEPVGDLVEMRRYTAGDPLRMVLWKVYARTRRLLVRMPERAVTPQPSLVAWFVPGAGDEATASTARTFLESGALGADFVFGADGSPELLTQPSAAVEAIIDSAHHRDSGANGLGALRRLDAGQLGNTLFFVPPRTGPWLDRLAAFARTLPRKPTLVCAIDAALEPSRKGWRRLVLDEAPVDTDQPSLAEVLALHEALSAIGAVRLFHRPTGQTVTPAQLRALRRRAA